MKKLSKTEAKLEKSNAYKKESLQQMKETLSVTSTYAAITHFEACSDFADQVSLSFFKSSAPSNTAKKLYKEAPLTRKVESGKYIIIKIKVYLHLVRPCVTFEAMQSRMDQVKFVKNNL